MNRDPFGLFRSQCESALKEAVAKTYPECLGPRLSLQTPPNIEFGELASSVPFDFSRKLKSTPLQVASKLVENVSLRDRSLIAKVEVAGGGYVNFHFNYSLGAPLIIESILKLDKEYGFIQTGEPKRIIVEHTSVNPIHPIHIGQGRNAALGDAIARVLKARGHNSSTHYYIDDTGRQVGLLAYGYEKLGRPKPEGKPDHFMGRIYSTTTCLVEIETLKSRLREAEQLGDEGLVKKIKSELDEWVSTVAELESKQPQLFNKMVTQIRSGEDHNRRIAEIMARYEMGDEAVRDEIRSVCKSCIEGFKQTLQRLEIKFDEWDWESDLIWTGRVSKVVDKLSRTRYVNKRDGTLELDAERVLEDMGLWAMLGLQEGHTVPSLTLTRSDGTTLYTTRDVAYSLWKFERADRVINVVGVEQSLAQLHVKVALSALGYKELAKRQEHFAFGLVELPGYKMSGRRGRYVSLDEVIDEAINRAMIEVSKRAPEMAEPERRRIAEVIALGAIKYALLAIEPLKNVIFVWDRIINFEMNSAPFINYAYTRTHGILRRIGERKEAADYSRLALPIEKELMILLSRFPEIFVEAAERLRPDDIAVYANTVAQRFHEYYEKVDVSHVSEDKLKNARANLVKAVQLVVRNAMNVLGIELAERM